MAHLPDLIVDTSMEADVFCEARLNPPGRDFLCIAVDFWNECSSVVDESRRVWLAIVLAIKMFHEIAHVLMFRQGFGGQVATTTPNVEAYLTPGGVLEFEAGDAFETLAFGGHISNFTPKESVQDSVYGLTFQALRMKKRVIPISWAISLLGAAFWVTAPQRLHPFPSTPAILAATAVDETFYAGETQYLSPDTVSPLSGHSTSPPVAAAANTVALSPTPRRRSLRQQIKNLMHIA